MPTLQEVLTSVLSAAASALTAVGRPAGLVHLAPGGQAAWDNCCDGGGQLSLRVIEQYPSGAPGTKFPALDANQQGGCGIHVLAIHLGLAVVRCAHTVDDNGIPPTAAEMSDDAGLMLADSEVLLNAIVCDIKDVPGVMLMKVDKWTSQGVEGGCAGGEWSFYIAYDPCLCQDD